MPRGRLFTRWSLPRLALLLLLAGYLMMGMPGRSHRGAPPSLSEAQTLLAERLAGHGRVLAGEIGERNLWHPQALEAAAAYVEQSFAAAGLEVVAQAYDAEGRAVRNLEVELPGTAAPDEIVVVGAHYDSVLGSPGANDNASGVAALIELARLLAERPHERTVRLVAFVNEEPPLFQSELMGSRRYARRAAERGEEIVAMLCLETIGYYDAAPGSQIYPSPLLAPFYPSRGDFIAFVGNFASRSLLRRSLKAFRRHATVPSEGLVAPAWVTGVDWSDHWSFWQEGYPAIMVTDTALFRYPHYHGAGDTPERVDYGQMARVVEGLKEVVADLAGLTAAGR